MSSAGKSAVLRAGRRFESASKPPIFSFSVTNSSGVIAPPSSAFRPYWMPTLSPVVKARLLPGGMPVVLPHTAAARSGSPHRVPFGLVTGSYTSAAGSRQLLRAAPTGAKTPVVWLITRIGTYLPGLLLKPNELFHDWQPRWSR